MLKETHWDGGQSSMLGPGKHGLVPKGQGSYASRELQAARCAHSTPIFLGLVPAHDSNPRESEQRKRYRC